MDIKNIQFIVFDIDGTLADTDDYYVDKNAHRLNKIIPFVKQEQLKKIVRPFIMKGETILHGFYRFLDLFGLDSIISKVHSRLSVKKEYEYKEIPGMQETIRELGKQYLIGIITSGSRKSTMAFLEKFHLEEDIKFIVSADDCKYIKPHPAPLLQIAQDAGVPPENCMLVGDTVFDILCAKRAGAYAVAVKSGFDSEWFLAKHKANLILDSVADLPKYLPVK